MFEMSEALSFIIDDGSVFEQIKGFMLDSLNVVLPIALGIFMIFFVWILAKKFFISVVAPKIDFYKNYHGFYDDDIKVDYEDEEDLSGSEEGYDEDDMY